MQSHSPSADRIAAALKAVRRTHAQHGEGEDKLSLGAKSLHVLIAQLTEEGVLQEDLQPLVEIEAILRDLKARGRSAASDANRRRGRPPSDRMLARVSAVVDLLIKAGREPPFITSMEGATLSGRLAAEAALGRTRHIPVKGLG